MIEIKPFENKYIEDAGKIFIENFRDLRKSYKELPDKFEKIDVITEKLSKIIETNPSSIALSKGKVIGYLTGISNIDNFKGSASGVYIPEWAHSSKKGNFKEKIYYNLYKHLAREWVDSKCTTQIITYFANDDILNQLLYRLAFGMLVIDGLRPMEEIKIEKQEGVITREAIEEDIPRLKILENGINKHLKSSPIFLNISSDELTDEEIKKNFFNKDVKTFLLEKDGEIVSCIRVMVNNGPNCDIVVDTGTLGVNFGYTKENMQGLGLASILLNHVIKWGLENDMKRLTVDFESQNREGYNFWLRHFNPICISSIRKIDDRI